MLDLNTASLRELLRLPGIGAVTANHIVEARPFTSIEELLAVKGIGPKRYAGLTAAPGCQVSINGSSKQNPETDISTVRSPRGAAGAASQPLLVDINEASEEELRQLPGIGPVIAMRITNARPFFRKEDLLAVKGIGTATYHKLHSQVIVADGGSSSRRSSGSGSSRSNAAEHSASAESDNDAESERYSDLQISPDMRSSVRSLRICREVDSNVRASLFSGTPHSKPKPEAILVASWNIRNISRQKDTFSLTRIAEIIHEFDLVALQEVRDTVVLKKLKTMLPGWDYVVSAAVGAMTSKMTTRTEHFAFLYRRAMFRVTDKCSLFVDEDNVFVRSPFLAHFVVVKPSGVPQVELTLVNVHVSCGEKHDRQRELLEIQQLADDIHAQRSVVVLGDFNLAQQDMLGRADSPMTPLVRAPLSTTVFGKMYDNIWMNVSDLLKQQQCNEIESGVYRIDWRYYPQSKPSFWSSAQHQRQWSRRRGSGVTPLSASPTTPPRLQAYMARVQCAYELSDHCPVWFALA
uniref:Endonuclease/exonuclease/phosphatase family domain-containing protein 1 n=1 Tax=Globisporangium ultimum (strain ATCC 200006 / CBS 805.95 / DAOM BR144) TaxID=431595 RepID=K3WUS6_GLOUD